MTLLTGVQPSAEEITRLLRERGISATSQRVRIAEALYTKPQHVSAEQVLGMVTKAEPAASKATVYNTLRLFAQKGLVREIIADPTRVFYEPVTNAHYHFFNVDTGELTDIPVGAVGLDRLPPTPMGTRLKGVDVVIRISSR